MDKVREIRLRKLRELIDEQFRGRPGPFADALKKKRPQIYRLFTDAPSKRRVGDKLARDIEQHFGKPAGWMDSEVDLVVTMRRTNDAMRVEAKQPKRPKANETLATVTTRKPPKLPANFRKEMIALLEKMQPAQRDEVRALARQICYDNVVAMRTEDRSRPMSTASIRIRSEGLKKNVSEPITSPRISDKKGKGRL